MPNAHVLASVNHVFNAVFVRGDIVGDTLFYGRGAGKDATASAVLSDLADAALDLKFGTKHRVPPFVPHECAGAVVPIEDVVSQYFVRLNVVDRPGVAGKNRGHFRRGENRHLVRHPARRPRRRKRAADFHAALRDQRRGERRVEKNRPVAGRQRQTGDDSGGEF